MRAVPPRLQFHFPPFNKHNFHTLELSHLNTLSKSTLENLEPITMKFLIILLVALLSALAMANPVDNIMSTANGTGNITAPHAMNTHSAQTTCDDCQAYFDRCYSVSSTGNPLGIAKTLC